MIYNEYRPLKFQDVIGQSSVEILKRQSIKNRFGHSYLFFGQSGSGKTTTARILAMALNCTNKAADGEPCGQCESCKAIIKGNHWDVIEIDGAKQNDIADIKDICNKAHFSPCLGGRKVYIIDECHRISIGAFNAMLKLLEEPPEHLAIILCTTNRKEVPDTIASRCQLYNFDPPAPAVIAKRLLTIAAAEDVTIPEANITQIANSVNGNIRQAETMLEQLICAI